MDIFRLDEDCTHPSCINLGVASPSASVPLRLALAESDVEPTTRDWLAGYPDPTGEAATRESIARLYAMLKAEVSSEDIFVTAGAHEELVLWGSRVLQWARIGVQVPCYPAILQPGSGNTFISIGFDFVQSRLLLPREGTLDALYVCNPHNPTGTALPQSEILRVIDWCIDTGTLLIYDNVYSSYIGDLGFSTIFNAPEAKQVAIEVNSLSKLAGLAGLRLGWVVVPREVQEGRLHKLRTALAGSVSAGVSRPAQAVARGVLSSRDTRHFVDLKHLYLRNAAILRQACAASGWPFVGGRQVPFLWVRMAELDALPFIQRLHADAGVLLSPGVIFGSDFSGWARMSAFCTPQLAEEAAERLGTWNL